MTFDVIEEIINNSNINIVTLLQEPGLGKNELERLLNSNLASINCTVDYEKYPELLYEYFYKLNIVNYPLICSNSINDFAENRVDLKVDRELSADELERLQIMFEKYPQDNVHIGFTFDKQLKEILSIIKSKKIIIKKQESLDLEKYEFFNENYDNIEIELDEDIYVKPKNLIEKERILSSIINEVKELNLSPLEEYMYLYNITKMLKEYREVPKDEGNDMLSRKPEFTLFNDYMVCVGYALLLNELVKKLGDPNLTLTPYSCVIEEDAEIIGHRRCLVKIKDEKYGVDGIYISDPTWDSIDYYKSQLNKEDDLFIPTAHFDFYNHFLMTKEEMIDEDIEYVSSDVTDILFKNIINSDPSEIKEFIYFEADNAIKNLNPRKKMDRGEIDAEITTIKQPSINSDILISAIRNLYSKIYYGSEEQIEALVEETIHNNQQVQRKHFNITKDKFNYQSKNLH